MNCSDHAIVVEGVPPHAREREPKAGSRQLVKQGRREKVGGKISRLVEAGEHETALRFVREELEMLTVGGPTLRPIPAPTFVVAAVVVTGISLCKVCVC